MVVVGAAMFTVVVSTLADARALSSVEDAGAADEFE